MGNFQTDVLRVRAAFKLMCCGRGNVQTDVLRVRVICGAVGPYMGPYRALYGPSFAAKELIQQCANIHLLIATSCHDWGRTFEQTTVFYICLMHTMQLTDSRINGRACLSAPVEFEPESSAHYRAVEIGGSLLKTLSLNFSCQGCQHCARGLIGAMIPQPIQCIADVLYL